jgi:hypothetical protein
MMNIAFPAPRPAQPAFRALGMVTLRSTNEWQAHGPLRSKTWLSSNSAARSLMAFSKDASWPREIMMLKLTNSFSLRGPGYATSALMGSTIERTRCSLCSRRLASTRSKHRPAAILVSCDVSPAAIASR